MRVKKIECPNPEGWGVDCPYCKDDECGIENPIKECECFMEYWSKDEVDEYTLNEPRTAFEDQ